MICGGVGLDGGATTKKYRTKQNLNLKESERNTTECYPKKRHGCTVLSPIPTKACAKLKNTKKR